MGKTPPRFDPSVASRASGTVDGQKRGRSTTYRGPEAQTHDTQASRGTGRYDAKRSRGWTVLSLHEG